MMGRFSELTRELEPSRMDVAEAVAVIRRTVEALDGASELPVSWVKVPTGGGRAFEFPGEAADSPEYVNSFTGVVLDARFVNARWDHAFGEAGADRSPVCVSHDGLSGYDAEGLEHSCRTCPWNRMGSRDGGRGKACRNMAQLLILAEGEALPVALRVPVMSVANWARYVARVLSPRGLMPCQVATRFSLIRASNSGGVEYSQIEFQCAGRVQDEEIRPLMGSLAPLLTGAVDPE